MAGREERPLPHQDHEGWLQRWKEGRINWHKTVVDPVLEVRAKFIIYTVVETDYFVAYNKGHDGIIVHFPL